MVDGLHIQPVEEGRPKPQPDSHDRDPALAASASSTGSAPAVPPGQGPPAPDPAHEKPGQEENRERGWKEGPPNADEEGSLNPGEVRLIDIPDQLDRQLAIRLDKESGDPIFEIRDRESGEVIRQIPPEELLVLARVIPELMEGLLIDSEG